MSGIVGYMIGEGLLGNPAYDTGPLVTEGMGEWVGDLGDLIVVGLGGFDEAVVADGVDYTIADDRPHFELAARRVHFALPDDRPHFTMGE
jgi:hypothetical protein